MPRVRIPWLASVAWLIGAALAPVSASPWAEVGDQGLRSDIEVLAAHGLVDGLVTTWPIPWAHISYRLGARDKTGLPLHVQRSLGRVRARMTHATAVGHLKAVAATRLTNEPALVRAFDTTARQEIDVRARAEYMSRWAAGRLSLGYQGDLGGGKVTLDDTYAALAAANLLVYGGVLDHWWGPGSVSGLILSNNARPFPRVGIMRNNPKAFETPWLSWIGPWQFNGFVGVLDESGRFVSNPLAIGMRLALSPLPGLELGASRTIMVCGSAPPSLPARPCGAGTFANAFLGRDNTGSLSDPSNQLAGLDARFTSSIGGVGFALYAEIIGEDEAAGKPSREAGLFGLSLWGGIGDGALWRLTTEYSDTTAEFRSSSPKFNTFYDHFIYQTGYRYRGRAIGHSLDGDTRLFSLVATLTDLRDWTYRLAYHHANINRDGGGVSDPAAVIANLRHSVSANAEVVNVLEAGLTIPWRRGTFEVELRLQDDQPNTPLVNDFEAAIAVNLSIHF